MKYKKAKNNEEVQIIKYKKTFPSKVFFVINTIFMIAFVVITLYPVLNTLAVSFNDGTDALRGGIHLLPRKFTLKNYKTVLQKDNLLTGAWISVLRTVIGTVTSLFANAILAFIISRKKRYSILVFEIIHHLVTIKKRRRCI